MRRGFIGVGVQPVRLPAGTVRAHDLGRDVGLMVISVDEGAPAHSAGISLGDVIVAFDCTIQSAQMQKAERIGKERAKEEDPALHKKQNQ